MSATDWLEIAYVFGAVTMTMYLIGGLAKHAAKEKKELNSGVLLVSIIAGLLWPAALLAGWLLDREEK